MSHDCEFTDELKYLGLFFDQLGLRDNQLIDLPREIGELTRLRELHIQNNRLTVLPPEVGEFQSKSSI